MDGLFVSGSARLDQQAARTSLADPPFEIIIEGGLELSGGSAVGKRASSKSWVTGQQAQRGPQAEPGLQMMVLASP